MENNILTIVPNMADIKICLSFERALNIWKPNMVDKLTITIIGAVICKRFILKREGSFMVMFNYYPYINPIAIYGSL